MLKCSFKILNCESHLNLCSIFTDKRFLGLGFGGLVGGRTSHCFPLNGRSRDPYCRGVDGLVSAYLESLREGKISIKLEYFVYAGYNVCNKILNNGTLLGQ